MNSYTFSSFLVVWKLERAVTRPDESSYCFVIEEKGYCHYGGVAIRMESTRKESLTPQPQRKYDLTIRARNVTIEIIEASEDNVKIRSNCAGEVNGSLYSGSYNDTVEVIPLQDGTHTVKIRYLHRTQGGELVWGTGTGTRGVPDPNGTTKLNAEGIMWTSSPRLSQLNGKRWVAEGHYNLKEESFEVIQQIRS